MPHPPPAHIAILWAMLNIAHIKAISLDGWCDVKDGVGGDGLKRLRTQLNWPPAPVKYA